MENTVTDEDGTYANSSTYKTTTTTVTCVASKRSQRTHLTDLPVEVFDRVWIDPHVWPRLACTCRFGRELVTQQRLRHFPRVAGIPYTPWMWTILQVAALLLTLTRWTTDTICVLKRCNVHKRIRTALRRDIERFQTTLLDAYIDIEHIHFKSGTVEFADAAEVVCYWKRARDCKPWDDIGDIYDVRNRFFVLHEYTNLLRDHLRMVRSTMDPAHIDGVLRAPRNIESRLSAYATLCPPREPHYKRLWF